MNISLRIANYISRYAPSEKKLREYIEKKNFRGEIWVLLSDIGYSEDLMLSLWMRTFIVRGIWERDIRMKLMKKWFPKEKILSTLQSFEWEIRDWENYEREISRKIEESLSRGKSKHYISSIFSGKYPYFRDQIASLLENTSDTPWLKKEIKKYKRKYNLANQNEKQKFFMAIQRKWFSYSAIRESLQEEESLHIS